MSWPRSLDLAADNPSGDDLPTDVAVPDPAAPLRLPAGEPAGDALKARPPERPRFRIVRERGEMLSFAPAAIAISSSSPTVRADHGDISSWA